MFNNAIATTRKRTHNLYCDAQERVNWALRPRSRNPNSCDLCPPCHPIDLSRLEPTKSHRITLNCGHSFHIKCLCTHMQECNIRRTGSLEGDNFKPAKCPNPACREPTNMTVQKLHAAEMINTISAGHHQLQETLDRVSQQLNLLETYSKESSTIAESTTNRIISFLNQNEKRMISPSLIKSIVQNGLNNATYESDHSEVIDINNDVLQILHMLEYAIPDTTEMLTRRMPKNPSAGNAYACLSAILNSNEYSYKFSSQILEPLPEHVANAAPNESSTHSDVRKWLTNTQKALAQNTNTLEELIYGNYGNINIALAIEEPPKETNNIVDTSFDALMTTLKAISYQFADLMTVAHLLFKFKDCPPDLLGTKIPITTSTESDEEEFTYISDSIAVNPNPPTIRLKEPPSQASSNFTIGFITVGSTPPIIGLKEANQALSNIINAFNTLMTTCASTGTEQQKNTVKKWSHELSNSFRQLTELVDALEKLGVDAGSSSLGSTAVSEYESTLTRLYRSAFHMGLTILGSTPEHIEMKLAEQGDILEQEGITSEELVALFNQGPQPKPKPRGTESASNENSRTAGEKLSNSTQIKSHISTAAKALLIVYLCLSLNRENRSILAS